MNINVADAMQILKNWFLEIRKSAVPSVTQKMLRKSFRSSAPPGLKDPSPVLLLQGQAAPPAVKPPAVRAGKKVFSQFRFEGIEPRHFYSGCANGLARCIWASFKGSPSMTKIAEPLSSVVLPRTTQVPFHETVSFTVES